MVAAAVRTYGRLDLAFNNAGVFGPEGRIHEAPEEQWDALIDINLKGTWLCMKYEIPQMIVQGHGAIVNTSSGAGVLGTPGLAHYCASKHAVLGLTKTAARTRIRR